jgi:hypothetical protein
MSRTSAQTINHLDKKKIALSVHSPYERKFRLAQEKPQIVVSVS